MDAKTLNKRKKTAIAITLILFFLSLITKVYKIDEGNINPTGYEIFAAGWIAVLNLDIYWMANPISVLAIIFFLFGKIRISLVLSAIALIIAIVFFILVKMESAPIEQIGKITSIGPGYYFWVASIFTVFISSIQLLRYSK